MIKYTVRFVEPSPWDVFPEFKGIFSVGDNVFEHVKYCPFCGERIEK